MAGSYLGPGRSLSKPSVCGLPAPPAGKRGCSGDFSTALKHVKKSLIAETHTCTWNKKFTLNDSPKQQNQIKCLVEEKDSEIHHMYFSPEVVFTVAHANTHRHILPLFK